MNSYTILNLITIKDLKRKTKHLQNESYDINDIIIDLNRALKNDINYFKIETLEQLHGNIDIDYYIEKLTEYQY